MLGRAIINWRASLKIKKEREKKERSSCSIRSYEIAGEFRKAVNTAGVGDDDGFASMRYVTRTGTTRCHNSVCIPISHADVFFFFFYISFFSLLINNFVIRQFCDDPTLRREFTRLAGSVSVVLHTCERSIRQ